MWYFTITYIYHNRSGELMACEYPAASESSIALTTLSLVHPWVQASYNGIIIIVHFNIIRFSWCTLIHRNGTLHSPEHCANIPGGTPTLADMFQGNVFTSEYVPLERFRIGTNPRWHRSIYTWTSHSRIYLLSIQNTDRQFYNYFWPFGWLEWVQL